MTFPTPEEIASLSPESLGERLSSLPGTLGERLGIRVTSATPECVQGVMPVQGNLQPAGRLHGGANVALAEELASIGSWLNLDVRARVAVGVDINATHVRGVTDGEVRAVATRAYRGRSVMLWNVEVRDARDRVTCVARCTCHVIQR